MNYKVAMLASFATMLAMLQSSATPLAAPAPSIDQRRSIASYARCVVEKDKIGARQLVATDPGSTAEKQAFLRLSRPIRECDHAVRATGYAPGGAIFRGAIAERFWTVYHFGGSAYPQPPSETVRFANGFAVAARLGAQYDLASCVVYRNPVAVDGLLRAAPGSSEERTALSRLSTDLRPCVSAGQTLALDRVLLRALLADMILRRYPIPTSPGRSEVLLGQNQK